MTPDDITRIAREADEYADSVFPSLPRPLGTRWTAVRNQRFAALVAAAEREACALECDKVYYQNIGDGFGEVRHGIAACAAAIRARSEHADVPE